MKSPELLPHQKKKKIQDMYFILKQNHQKRQIVPSPKAGARFLIALVADKQENYCHFIFDFLYPLQNNSATNE